VARVIYIEVLDRRGKVTMRSRVDHMPYTAGTAYSNDLILDDAHASPEHFVLETRSGGGVTLRDLDSTNGLLDSATGRSISDVPLEGEHSVRVGRTTIRFRFSDHTSVPAVPDHPEGGWISRLAGSPATIAPITLLLVAVAVLSNVRSSWAEVELFELANSTLLFMLLLFGWSGGWALAGRVLHQRSDFEAHWILVCLAVVMKSVLDLVVEFARFAVSDIAVVETGDLAAKFLLLAWLIASHIRLATTIVPGRRASAGAVAALLALGLFQAEYFTSSPDFVSTLPYWSRLEPVSPRLLVRESPDDFFEGAKLLQPEVDDLAAKANLEKARERYADPLE